MWVLFFFPSLLVRGWTKCKEIFSCSSFLDRSSMFVQKMCTGNGNDPERKKNILALILLFFSLIFFFSLTHIHTHMHSHFLSLPLFLSLSSSLSLCLLQHSYPRFLFLSLLHFHPSVKLTSHSVSIFSPAGYDQDGLRDCQQR